MIFFSSTLTLEELEAAANPDRGAKRCKNLVAWSPDVDYISASSAHHARASSRCNMARMLLAALLLPAALGLSRRRGISRARRRCARTPTGVQVRQRRRRVLLRWPAGRRRAAPRAAPAADGFEVTMSGLKFKDEVRFSVRVLCASLHAIDVTCVSRRPRASGTNVRRRRHRRDDAATPTAPHQRRSSARARAPRRAMS